MKTIVEIINEAKVNIKNKKFKYEVPLRNNKKSVTISEKDFNKIARGNTVTTPYPNKTVKVLNGDESVTFTVVPSGAYIEVSEMSDKDKKWFFASSYNYIKDITVYELSASDNADDMIWIPRHELMNPLPKFGSDPNENELGMLPISGNFGSFSHAFTDKNIDKVLSMYEEMGFKIIWKK